MCVVVFPEDKTRELAADSSNTKYFILTVQQKTLLLNVSINPFISPSLVNVNRLCYYTGYIQSIDNEVIGSTAFSICNGMVWECTCYDNKLNYFNYLVWITLFTKYYI